jgi:hypothetical protein
MGHFCLAHDILGVQKSLRIVLGGGLPLFTNIREVVAFSGTFVHYSANIEPIGAMILWLLSTSALIQNTIRGGAG